jgi:ATP-dependent DNA ligase
MAPSIGKQPFDRPGWLFELKYDGYRAIALMRDLKSIAAASRETPAAAIFAFDLIALRGEDLRRHRLTTRKRC